LNKHGLELFGWYRIVLAAVLLIAVLFGLVSFTPEQA